ncbi:MAG: YIP1 family protein [Steroidobacteraceae bacterium]
MNNLGLSSALLFEPRKVFMELDARPRFWFPLLVVIVTTVVIAVWYRSVVDIEWVTDRAMRTSAFASRLTEAQIEEAVKRSVERKTLGTVATTLGTPIVIVVVGMLGALYLLLAGKATRVRRSFRHWFALTWWAALPAAVFGLVAAAFVLLTTTTAQFDQTELKPLSLNALLMHRNFDQPGYALFGSIDLFQLFSMYLSVVAVRTWSGRSWLFSSIFALLPYLLIYGIWAFISLR